MAVSRLEPDASLSYKAGRGSDKVNEKLSSYRKNSEIIGLRWEKLPRRVSFIDFLRDDKKINTDTKRFLAFWNRLTTTTMEYKDVNTSCSGCSKVVPTCICRLGHASINKQSEVIFSLKRRVACVFTLEIQTVCFINKRPKIWKRYWRDLPTHFNPINQSVLEICHFYIFLEHYVYRVVLEPPPPPTVLTNFTSELRFNYLTKTSFIYVHKLTS